MARGCLEFYDRGFRGAMSVRCAVCCSRRYVWCARYHCYVCVEDTWAKIGEAWLPHTLLQ